MNTKANRGRTLDMLFAAGSPGSAAAWFRNDESLEAEQRRAKRERVLSADQQSQQRNKDFNFFP
jgi:hypothetical protein